SSNRQQQGNSAVHHLARSVPMRRDSWRRPLNRQNGRNYWPVFEPRFSYVAFGIIEKWRIWPHLSRRCSEPKRRATACVWLTVREGTKDPRTWLSQGPGCNGIFRAVLRGNCHPDLPIFSWHGHCGRYSARGERYGGRKRSLG